MKNLFTKSAIIKFKFYEIFFCGDETRFYKLEDVANELDVNINTVKQVFAFFKERGYFESVRGKGFKVNSKFRSRKGNFPAFLNEFTRFVGKLKNSGCYEEEILFLFYHSIDKKIESDVYYVDEDYVNLYIGKKELEEILKRDVHPLLIDEAVTQLENRIIDECLIITTYYCAKKLEKYESSFVKIFPLKITPPIDFLLNFSKISSTDKVIVVTVNEEIRQRFENSYQALKRKFKNIEFVTINDLMLDNRIVESARYVLTLKYLYNSNPQLFKKVRNLIVYSRFHDDDGINMLIDIVKDK